MGTWQVTFEWPDGTGEIETVWEGEAEDRQHAIDLAREEHGDAKMKDVRLQVRHPEVEVGADHILHHPISAVRSALRLARIPREEILEFTNEAIDASDKPEGMAAIARKWVTIT